MFKEKYLVTAYKRVAIFDKNLRYVHRWVKINSWAYASKAVALKCVKIWCNYKQPFFKATIKSLRNTDKL